MGSWWRLRRLHSTVAAAAVAVVASTASAGPAPLVRYVARDTTAAPGFQHESVVEPWIASGRGGVLVTVFQVGRGVGRGAAAVGFATSTDAGRTWRNGLFEPVTRPELTPSRPVDVTDAVVAYDSAHRMWLVASIADFANGSRSLQVHRSGDGLHWSGPVEVARGVIDHESLACDGWARSPLRGRCYLAFSRLDAARLGVRRSSDAGGTWSDETRVASPLGRPSGASAVVRPDGSLVVLFREGGSRLSDGRRPPFTYTAVRSVDGGESFGEASRVGVVRPYLMPHFRGDSMLVPAVAADARGRVYAAWHSCRFRRPCRGNDLVLSRSSDGTRWRAPRRLPLDRRGNHVLPGLGIAPAARGRGVRLGLAYYTIAGTRCRPERCRLAPQFVASANGGRTWSRPLRLHRPMPFTWLPESPRGAAFVADTISTAFVGTTAWPAVVVAKPPRRGQLRVTVAVARVRRAELGR